MKGPRGVCRYYKRHSIEPFTVDSKKFGIRGSFKGAWGVDARQRLS